MLVCVCVHFATPKRSGRKKPSSAVDHDDRPNQYVLKLEQLFKREPLFFYISIGKRLIDCYKAGHGFFFEFSFFFFLPVPASSELAGITQVR